MVEIIKYYRDKEKIRQDRLEHKVSIGMVARMLDCYIEDDKHSKYYAVINQKNKELLVYINRSNYVQSFEFYNN